jgi:hypothetical protein
MCHIRLLPTIGLKQKNCKTGISNKGKRGRGFAEQEAKNAPQCY